ncbi:MAG: YciI family protein [Pseudomonadota bacterium]
MIYAILAYHEEHIVTSWTAEEDAALMTELLKVHDAHVRAGHLGPAARLGGTDQAKTLRGSGLGAVLDGPFAETKEQLLGFYLVDCPDEDSALAVARDLKRVNPTAVYEIRPVSLFIPGAPLEGAE